MVTRERCVTILRCIPAPRLRALSQVVPARLDRSDLTTARSIWQLSDWMGDQLRYYPWSLFFCCLLFYVRTEGTWLCGYTRAPCVTMLCCTSAFGLYGCESDTITVFLSLGSWLSYFREMSLIITLLLYSTRYNKTHSPIVNNNTTSNRLIFDLTYKGSVWNTLTIVRSLEL